MPLLGGNQRVFPQPLSSFSWQDARWSHWIRIGSRAKTKRATHPRTGYELTSGETIQAGKKRGKKKERKVSTREEHKKAGESHAVHQQGQGCPQTDAPMRWQCMGQSHIEETTGRWSVRGHDGLSMITVGLRRECYVGYMGKEENYTLAISEHEGWPARLKNTKILNMSKSMFALMALDLHTKRKRLK